MATCKPFSSPLSSRFWHLSLGFQKKNLLKTWKLSECGQQKHIEKNAFVTLEHSFFIFHFLSYTLLYFVIPAIPRQHPSTIKWLNEIQHKYRQYLNACTKVVRICTKFHKFSKTLYLPIFQSAKIDLFCLNGHVCSENSTVWLSSQNLQVKQNRMKCKDDVCRKMNQGNGTKTNFVSVFP